MVTSGPGGVSPYFDNFPQSGITTRGMRKTIAPSDHDNFGDAAALFGIEWALETSRRPHLLHAAQKVVDTTTAQWERANKFYTDKLRLAGIQGRALQAELFTTKVDSMTQTLINEDTEKKLRAQLLAAERRSQHNNHGDAQAAEMHAPLPENTVARSFHGPEAKESLGKFLQLFKGRPDYTPAQLVPYFRAFANVIHDEDVAAAEEAVIAHPVLLEAFNLLNSEDEAILDAAVSAILAAIDLCSAAGTMVEGYERLCMYLAEGVANLARWMKHFASIATTGDLSQEAKAAAYAKLLGAAATAFMCPVQSFLKDELSEKLIEGMVAVRLYPEASIAAEGALFWRILGDAYEMAEDHAERWNLPEAEELSSLTEELQLWLLSTLYKSAVLPEKLWGSMSTGQQDVLLQRRGAMAEPLLEAVELFGFERTMEVLEGLCKECKDKKWGKWSPDEALLACVNMLHRASPPLAEFKLIFLFQRLWSLPLKGNLTATAVEIVTLYTPWVHATAEEAPGEAAEILEDFSCFMNTEEAVAQQAQKAQSEASEELLSEDSSEYDSDSDSQSSDFDAIAADVSAADIITGADIIIAADAGLEAGPEEDADSEGSDSEAEYISTTCLPHQPVPTGIAHSMPSGASRGPPPGFERPAPQVAPAQTADAPTCPPCQPSPTGANASRPSGAPRGSPPGFERPAPQVASAPTMTAQTCPPCQPPLTGVDSSRPSGAPRGPPPGFERPAPEVASAPTMTASTCPPCQPPLTGANSSRPSGAPRGAPPGFERPAPQVVPDFPQESLPAQVDNSTAVSAPGAIAKPTPLDNTILSGAPPAALLESQRPAVQEVPLSHVDSVPSQTETSAAVSATDAHPEPAAQNLGAPGLPAAEDTSQAAPLDRQDNLRSQTDRSAAVSAAGAVPDNSAQSASEAEAEAELVSPAQDEQAESGAAQQDAPAQEEAVAAAPSAALPGGSPSEPADSSAAVSTPGAVTDSTAKSTSEPESDSPSTEQAESGAVQQDALAQVESVAAAPSKALPGSFAGKMFYAAGALVGTVQGCARLFI